MAGALNNGDLTAEAPTVGCLTQPEVLAAINALTVAEKTAIVKVTKVYAQKGRSINDHNDLLHEAIVRILEQKRAWPRGLSAVQFFVGVIQSIVSERKYKFLNQGKGAEEVEKAEKQAATERWKDEERERAAADKATEYRTKAITLFDDDAVARKVFLLMLDGVKGVRLRALSGLSDTEYDNCRRKIRRRLETLRSD